VQLCVDFGAQLFWVTNNGGYWNGNINASPANGTGGISFSTIPGGPWFVGYCSANAGDQATVNFGASAFNYTPPTGFSAWGGGFGGGVIRPAALANYPSWKEYRNWQFGSNTGNNIQSLSELANDGWVHSEPPYYNNADEVELFNTDMTDTNENVVFSTNHCDIVAIWTGKTIGDGPPSGNVSSMQVMLPLDTAVPPLTSIAYVEGWFKCPNVPGAWPTWWSIGHRIGGSASETTWGPEIDFMEIVTDPSYSSHSQVSNFFAGTLHAASSSGNELPNQCFLESQSKYNIPLGHVDYNTSEVTYRPPSFKSEIPQYKLGTFQVKGFINATTAYHRWGCLIEPNHTISIWIDGTKIGHYDATQYCSDGGTPVALNLMIDLALSQTAGMISTSNFYKKNYNGPKNLFRLSMKGVQIWGPPS
ncbi:MAG TPA: hypothetical protein VMF67_02075, partial [Rhizomicrobium sp.]|nr:hypothetical protein [Rhizomicrobium sp.]